MMTSPIGTQLETSNPLLNKKLMAAQGLENSESDFSSTF